MSIFQNLRLRKACPPCRMNSGFEKLPRLVYGVFNCFLILNLSTSLCYGQWDDKDLLPSSVYSARRESLREQLPDSSAAVFFANPVRNRSNDVDFQYSQDPNFYYLTGCTEPDALLLIFKYDRNIDGSLVHEILFIQPRNPKEEIWTGKRMGQEGAQRISGVKTVMLNSDFKDFGLDWMKFKKVLVLFPDLPNDDPRDKGDLADLVQQFKDKTSSISERLDQAKLSRLMAGMREVKSTEELVFMQKAIDASAAGFKEMMKSLKPGMTEYQAQAMVEYYMKKGGCEYQGYPSISGSGGNGCVLHYTFNRKELANNDLLLADMGGEYHGYTADITRTVPVNGKFLEAQKQIYELVLDAQNAGIKACKKGNSFHDPHIAAKKVISDGLIKLGIIKSEDEVSTYFMHGTSHYLGLDVHDAGLYGPLEEGNVITVEPGIYIAAGSPCDQKYWNIGVRIEDDVLITDGKPTVLSESIPRSVKDIEKLMGQEGAFK